MRSRILSRLLAWRTWQIVLFSIVGAVFITDSVIAVISVLVYGVVHIDLLILGTVNATLVPCLMVPIIIKLLRVMIREDGQNLFHQAIIQNKEKGQQLDARHANEMALLHQLGVALAAGKNLYDTLLVLQSEIIKIIQFDAFYVGIYDSETGLVRYPISLNAGQSVAESSRSLLERPGLTGAVIFNGKTLYLPDMVSQDIEETYQPVDETDLVVHTFLGIPLISEGNVLGMLSVQSREVDAYLPDQIQLMESMAAQAAVAIDRARLLDQLQRELDERKRVEVALQQSAVRLEVIHEIDRALLSAHSPGEIAKGALDGIRKLIPCLRASITLFNFERSESTFLALSFADHTYVTDRKAITLDEFGRYIVDELKLNQPVFIDDVLAEVRATRVDKELAEDGFRTWLYMPLLYHDELIGSLNLARTAGEHFMPEDADRVRDVADLLAVVIQQARLHTSLQLELAARKQVEISLRERDAILESVTFAAEQFLKSEDWRANIDQVMGHLGRTVRATHVYLFEHFIGVDEVEYSSLKYEWTATGYSSDFENPYYQQPQPVSMGSDDIDSQLHQGLFYAGNISNFPYSGRERLQTLGIKAMLELPVLVSGKWWGTFGIDDLDKEREWTSAEVDVLKVAVEILGAAIQRQNTEAAVRESERIYRQAIEAAGAVPYYRDYRENRYAFMGGAVEQIIGYKPEEITAALLSEIVKENIPIGEGTSLQINDAMVRARTGSLRVWRSDMRVIARNGNEKWLTDSAVELFDDKNLSYASIGILQDVTDRKHIESRLRKREAILQTITFAAEQFLQTPDWREKINLVLERLGKELNVSHAYLFEKHNQQDGADAISIIYEWTAPNYPSSLDNEQFKDMFPTPIGNNRLYDILESGEPLVGSSSFFTEEEREYIKSVRVKALLEMRVMVNGQHWGTLGFDQVDKEREWIPMEVDVIRVASNVLSAAIKRQSDEAVLQKELDERRKLIQELELRNAESETLRESVAIVAATLEKAEAVDQILEQLARVVPYDSASVQLINGNLLEIIKSRGAKLKAGEIGQGFEINESEPAYPVLTGMAPYILYDDVQEALPQFNKIPHQGIHAWMAIPLKVKGVCIGIIALDGKRRGQFTERDAKLAATYANQVVITLENARLFSDLQKELDERKKLIEELERRNAESETLRETTAIVAATLERKEAIDRILEQLERVVHYNSASVQLLDEDNLEIVSVRGLANDQEHIGLQFPLDENEQSYPVVRGNVPYMLFDDIQVVSAAFREPPHDVIHAWMVVPLKVEDQIIGIIALDGHRVGQFTERDAKLAVTYANQVAIALEKARLFSDLQNELGERKKLISELESKNSELERFTYTVSHDLKSPLVTINGFLGYLEEDTRSGNIERMRRDMQRIHDSVKKMQKLLNELLELSRIGRVINPPEEISFSGLAHEVLNLVQGRLEERRVTVFIQPDLPVVSVDKPRIIEVLQNLLDNAAKYMGDQPHPRIEVGQRGDENGLPIFYVQDNGIGIAPEFYDRIFGLFNKLDPTSEGTGVGLALVKRIIEIHGGKIWIESEPEMGSTFFFTLPIPEV